MVNIITESESFGFSTSLKDANFKSQCSQAYQFLQVFTGAQCF